MAKEVGERVGFIRGFNSSPELRGTKTLGREAFLELPTVSACVHRSSPLPPPSDRSTSRHTRGPSSKNCRLFRLPAFMQHPRCHFPYTSTKIGGIVAELTRVPGSFLPEPTRRGQDEHRSNSPNYPSQVAGRLEMVCSALCETRRLDN